MLLTAGVVTIVFRKINQPMVLGYILAGFLIGPYFSGFFTVADQASISTWSEIGIIILMFALGLEFNLHKLAEVGMTGVITAMTEVVGMLLIGYAVGQALGWTVMDSIFLGGMLSMSSTTIIIKAFDELGVRKESFAELVFGTLVIEDIAGIFMMIILSTMSAGKNVSGAALAGKLGLLVLYLALWLILGIYLLPTLLNKASSLMSDETLLIVSLGICFGMVLLADALGFSSALGAFLAGSLLAGTVHAERIEHLCAGVKDLFGAVFFLSVGMMIDPSMIVKYIVPILILSVVTVFGKLLMSSLGVLLSGNSLKNAIHCGCSLAQIGEFAFIIASLGLSLGVVADYVYPVIVSVSVITTLTTPFFIRSADKICALIEKALPEKLVNKLDRYTGEAEETHPAESDWKAYLSRYAKKCLIYGVIMLGIAIIGHRQLLPLVENYFGKSPLISGISLAVILFIMAIFIRPMLDMDSPQYTSLWLESKRNRLPLLTLSIFRIVMIVLLMFIPAQSVGGINGVWLIIIVFAILVISVNSGWLASKYLSVEARFLANFNERKLQSFADSDSVTEWLDEKLMVLELTYNSDEKTLAGLDWGRRFGVNVIKIVRGKRHINMPLAKVKLRHGDRLFVLGESEQLNALKLELGADGSGESEQTLRSFTEEENNSETDIYSYALPIDKGSSLTGKSIKDCGLRDNYDCMILGIQRNNLPIAQPDINMTIQNGDLIWILGTKTMAEHVLMNIE